MSNEMVITGVGGGIVGLLVGVMISGTDTDDLEERMIKEMDTRAAEQLEATANQFAALDEKLAGLQAAVSDGSGANAQLGAAVSSQIEGAVTALSGKLDTMSETVASSVSESIAAASATQSEQLSAALGGQLSDIAAAVSQVSVAASAAAPSAVAAVAATPAPAEPEIEGVRPGQTELLLDGMARVFVSSVDDAGGIARVAVNGLKMQELGGYEDVIFEIDGKSCVLLLDDVVEGHVQMSATCDD